jgi:hypothetical protein
MAAYSGSALQVVWNYSGGSLIMEADFRTFTYTPAVDLYEQSAGADVAKSYLSGIKSGQASFSGVEQAGSFATFGSLCGEGVVGTIVYKPEGTAAGKLHGTIPAICMGYSYNQQYNNVVEVSVNWTQNGARTEGTLGG